MARAAVIQHVCFEDLGTLRPALEARGFQLDFFEAPLTDFRNLDPLEWDLAVVLGGPVGVYEEQLYPFLAAETKWLSNRLAMGKPTLGICLGAQLIAAALGARVYPGPSKEIGWAAVELTPAGRRSCLRLLAGPDGQTQVLHWHGDTFDLPEDAELLASTTLYPHQAFTWGGCALALQFHIEVSAPGLERWLVGHAVEIARTPGVTVEGLRQGGRQFAGRLEAIAGRIVDEWLDKRSVSTKTSREKYPIA